MNRWRLRLSVTGLVLLALWYAPKMAELSLCGFRWLTGYPCPLCGMTHALSAMVHGQWGEAVRFHPLSPVVMMTGLTLLAGAPGSRIPWKLLISLFVVYGISRILTT